eukprot:Amastigsp_a845912_14.p4 type:complete len:100 gc:universal Amastigsp_a845912_14:378-79(-)
MRTSRGNAPNCPGAKPVIRQASSWRWSETAPGNANGLQARQLKHSWSARRRAMSVAVRSLRTQRRVASSMCARVNRPWFVLAVLTSSSGPASSSATTAV